MGDMLKEYFEDPGKQREHSTSKNYRLISRAIEEVIGYDTFAHQVTRQQCRKISSLVLEIPKNATKSIKADSLEEIIRIGKEKGMEKLAASTHNTYMEKLGALMHYAVQEGYADRNPARGLSVKEKYKSNVKRLPFDKEQLDKIFNAPLYTGCEDDERGYNKPGEAKPRRARFWVPLISLWTGMRLNEICQLHVTDIVVQDGVKLILIQTNDEADDDEDEEKRVKTEAGIRFVPIHPMLERFGFLEYVESRRLSNQRRLFPELPKGPHGGYGHDMSKWFGRFTINIGAKKPRTAFHSFRHLYRDALREAELPLDAALQLGGWSRGTTDADYGKGLKPQTLYKHILKISYPDVDLSHLYAKKG